ncbi:MAG: DGQHR domain-containing protein [Candidatus Binatia bacterium]
MSDKGAELNKRVWTVFERAGFQTKPNSSDTAEEIVTLTGGNKRPLDLSATIKELGVKIVGQNTTAPNLKQPFSGYIHDLQELMKPANAKAGLVVLTGREVSAPEKELAQEKGIKVWGQDELKYYEVVVDAIGEYAKYEIINSFGITTEEEKTIYHALALRFQQPFSGSDTDLFLFTFTPEKLLKTSVICRRAQGNASAYQRMLRKERLRSVRKFVTQEGALLPPNIIVHFSDKITWERVKPEKDVSGKPINITQEKACELVVLKIPMAYASLELIDGQHRLYGFSAAEPATKANFNLVVLGLANLPSSKRRDTFVAINDKSRRMDPNLVAYLKYTENEAECQKDNELMAIRIVVELNRTTPFKDKIRLLDIGTQRLTLKGFSGYDLKGLLGPRGSLRKYYANESKEYVSALRLYLSVLKSLFEKQWRDPEKYIIFTNRGISAFLKLMKSILNTSKRQLDQATVKKYLQPLKDKWKDRDWETERLRSAYVGSKGWIDFHRELVKVIRRKLPLRAGDSGHFPDIVISDWLYNYLAVPVV